MRNKAAKHCSQGEIYYSFVVTEKVMSTYEATRTYQATLKTNDLPRSQPKNSLCTDVIHFHQHQSIFWVKVTMATSLLVSSGP